jgi:tRNA(Arg) A34 adenosine deaminase TadA
MHNASQEEMNGRDLAYLLHAIDLSYQARQEGMPPFGAVVVDADGIIVAEAMPHFQPPDGDPTQHAELLAAGQAAQRRGATQLRYCTLYSSAEPCAMCAAAIYACGIGRIVYGLSQASLLRLADGEVHAALSLSCREVLARGLRHTDVLGPLLEDDAAEAHSGSHYGRDSE